MPGGRINSLLTKLRLLSEVTDSDCWKWIGGIANGTGCPTFTETTPQVTVDSVYLKHINEGASQIRRICGNRRCVNPDHFQIERSAKNPNNGLHLPAEVKKEIFSFYKGGGWSQKGLAFKYGLSESTVYNIIKKEKGLEP